jgi:hypothetical protein
LLDRPDTTNFAVVGISHKAVLLRETAKPALFRATTNILSERPPPSQSARRLAAPVPIRPLVADRQSIRDGHAKRRNNSTLNILSERPPPSQSVRRLAAPVPIRPLVADRQSIRDGHAERRNNSTLTDIRHEGVRKIFRKTRSPSEPPTASTDLTNSAVLLNCSRSMLQAPRHDSPDYSRASQRAPPRPSFRHAKTFSRTNFAQHKHSACV